MTSLADRFNAVCDKHLSENTRDGTNCCKNEVVLHHKDTLGYPLPAGIVVNVYDETGKVHRGVIDENGVSRHGVGPVDPTGGNPQVHCGEISWQLLREPSISPVISPNTNKKIEGIRRQLADKDETIIHYPSDGYVLIKAKARDEKNSVPSPNPKYQLSNPLTIEAHWQNGGYECHIDATYLPPPLT
ncbi:hypothetical protein P7M46_07545, partial [Bisgaard Taxon 10/6]|nr:hypothetical protein [Exercitatus varius]